MPVQNPFTTTFSKIPKRTCIKRDELDKLIENFSFEDPTESVYKITGVRGSGKTVGLAQIESLYRAEENAENGWLVYSLNPSRDMLVQFGASLAKEKFIHQKLDSISANVNLNILGAGVGFGASVKNKEEISDIGVLIETMLKAAADNRKKIMLTVDEVSKTHEMVQFCLEYGKWLRRGFPVYLVCTGLYENITELGNTKNLTFFKRAPAIKMEALNRILIVEAYKKTLGKETKDCQKLANMTKGYAYAFQQLGSLMFEGSNEDAVDDLKSVLFGNVYEKIWDELTENERYFLKAMKEDREYKREEIIEALADRSGNYSSYRDRLLRKGIIAKANYGYIKITLPFFNEYIEEYCY